MPAIEVTLITVPPPRCLKMGITARVVLNTPKTLVSNMARTDSSLDCSNAAWPP